MSRWKIVLGVVVVLALVAYALRGPLSLRIMERALPRMMTADPLAGLTDGLHLTLCGAGSPLPDPNRSGPCVGVVAGQNLHLNRLRHIGPHLGELLGRLGIGWHTRPNTRSKGTEAAKVA